MHAGRVVVTGTVAELVDDAGTTMITLAPGADPGPVADAVRRAAGVSDVDVQPDTGDGARLVVTSDLPRAEVVRVVAAAGEVVAVSSRRQLEEVFLGVIAQAASGGGSDPDLRQVRSR
jgi:ABC-2 type transport system ATP-binding protein